jgi:tetratricopeptide (TPR) repeat protein
LYDYETCVQAFHSKTKPREIKAKLKNPLLNEIFAMLFFLGGAGFPPQPCLAAPPLQMARQYLDAGKLDEAKSLLQNWLQENPGSPEALFLLGNLHLAEDQSDMAQKDAEELLHLRPDWAQSLSLHGFVLLRQGEFELAEAAFKKCLQQNPRIPEAYLGMGRIYLSRRQEKEALEAFKKAIALNSRLADAYYYSAEAYGSSRGQQAQIRAVEKYLALRPVFPAERIQNARSMLQFLKSCRNLELNRIESPDSRHEVAVESFFGLMIVRSFVNGKGPYKFLVDTGASATVLSNTLFDSLDIQTRSTAVIKCVGGAGRMVTRMGLANRLTLGTLELRNVPVGTFDNSQMANLIDGVLSPTDLSDFIITFRPSAQKMILSCRNCPAQPRPPEETGTGRSIDLRMIGSLLLIPASLQPALSGGFLLDTGALMSVLSSKNAKILGGDPDQANSSIDLQFAGACGVTQSVIPLKDITVKIRDLRKNYPQILALDLSEISKELQTEIIGILGMDFWGDRTLTLDYSTGRFWIE